ncbi:hypothetical protein E2C01_055578 [Portunus trituberculatus]|uniref:Uncharacterized protein n=1 Tax=Portunus trituberculatus TaxID=210409 RepID=A0A5B7GVW6_PORTR|nr:hypothetical protein [Portunus trituberculatus]
MQGADLQYFVSPVGDNGDIEHTNLLRHTFQNSKSTKHNIQTNNTTFTQLTTFTDFRKQNPKVNKQHTQGKNTSTNDQPAQNT